MNQKELIWDLAQLHASEIVFSDSRATKIQMTEENLHEFAKHIFSLFREELRPKIDYPEDSLYDVGYNQAVADCMAETLVFTGEVE